MIQLKEKAQNLFDLQTAGKSLSEVRELSFAQCCISDVLLTTSFSQLTNLSRITLVAMKPPLKDKSFEAILSALPESAKQNTLRAIDVCDNGISSFPLASSSTSSFPKLVRLIIANNNVESFESIFGASGNAAADAQKAFPALRTLDVEDNGVSREAAKKAFELFSSLVVVNGKNKEGEDWHDASDDDFDEDDVVDGGDEGEGNGDVDAFVDQDDDDGDDAEEFAGNNNSNENTKESPARRNREE